MTDAYLLPILLVLPFVGALACALMPAGKTTRNDKPARGTALVVSLLTLVLAAVLVSRTYPMQTADSSTLSPLSWGGELKDNTLSVNELKFSLHLGCDAVSLSLILLAALVVPLALLAGVGSVPERTKEFSVWMLALLGSLIGVFLARDVLLFYVFFELTLIPSLFLIGVWGGPNRREAAGKFFLYTFAGSVFLLIGLIYVSVRVDSLDLERVIAGAQQLLSPREQFWIGLALLVGFLVKTPVFPLHTWQALTYSESPSPASAVFAGVLSKLGTYGLLRLTLPAVFIDKAGLASGTLPLLNVVAVLAVIGILYGALVAWVQRDFFKLLAFSSLSHLGFCVLGLTSMNTIGLQGAVLYMVNHGLSTAALFFCLGMVQDRLKTREIDRMSGLFKVMPVLSVFFVLFTMASIGLPGLNGFPSEFLTLTGAFTSGHLGIVLTSVAASGMVLGAIYMLHLVAKVFFGPVKVPDGSVVRDLGAREIGLLAPLALLVIVLGVQPGIVLDAVKEPVESVRKPLAIEFPSQGVRTGSPPRLGGTIPEMTRP